MSTKMSIALAVVVVLLAISGGHSQDYSGRRLTDCLEQADFVCAKQKILSNLNKVLQMRSFRLFNGITIEKDEDASDVDEEPVVENSRAFGGSEDRLDNNLIATILRMFRNRSLRLDLFPEFSARISGSKQNNGLVDISIETPRGSGGIGGQKGLKKGGGIFLLGGMFGATLLTVGLAVLKALAFKALLVGKISLLLAAINGIKELIGGGQKKQYAVYENYDFYDKHAPVIGDEQFVHSRAYSAQMPAQQATQS